MNCGISLVKKRKFWVWIAYGGQGRAFWLGGRDRKSCERLFQKLNRFEVRYFYAVDYPAYRQVIPQDKHVATKSQYLRYSKALILGYAIIWRDFIAEHFAIQRL